MLLLGLAECAEAFIEIFLFVAILMSPFFLFALIAGTTKCPYCKRKSGLESALNSIYCRWCDKFFNYLE